MLLCNLSYFELKGLITLAGKFIVLKKGLSLARFNFITYVLLYAIALLAFVSVGIQTFGAEIGVNFASNKVQFEDVNVSNSETEFYVEVFAQIEISEKFVSQHEIRHGLLMILIKLTFH
jgi:hypothetical protein